jgi:hypothetical protein
MEIRKEEEPNISNIYTEEYEPNPKFRIIFSILLFFFVSQVL